MKLLTGIISLIIFGFISITPAFATNKKIEIDLTTQRLYAFEEGNKIYDIAISSGKSWWPTPIGTFKP